MVAPGLNQNHQGGSFFLTSLPLAEDFRPRRCTMYAVSVLCRRAGLQLFLALRQCILRRSGGDCLSNHSISSPACATVYGAECLAQDDCFSGCQKEQLIHFSELTISLTSQRKQENILEKMSGLESSGSIPVSSSQMTIHPTFFFSGTAMAVLANQYFCLHCL